MGMIEAHWGQKINRFRIVCLFWSNLCRLIMSYLVLKEMKYDEKQGEKDPVLAKTHKKRVLAVWDGILMTLFAYTLQKGARPAGPGHLPKALESGSVIELLTCLVPPIYTVPTTPQGILGVASLVPSILMGLV
ncbi:hypothetical protein AGDE_09846 [Angomonas deanei]|uniref:Uncharacterized protein n=1 Tax=Angomonas deanei TaxID=59799 RepID=A0A7G2CCS8_9TRYP|nr:hypothetical protein AGDE_09846 [Angomonas deanei]CAD2216664.1 hypothetical protein, conserved [Angomonas deanei]|eukprot:EPY29765.1 hypothetical protein AGDE_09846 [Angomonas deanei]